VTWRTRFKLLTGLMLVVLLAGVLTIELGDRMSTARAVSATLRAQTYDVGTDYAGVIVQDYVELGDTVEAGEPLFALRSNGLSRDLANGLVSPEESPYGIQGNTIVLQAATPGTVTGVQYVKGAFVPVNATMATIEVAESLYVEADFRLQPSEYALMREAREITITLPNERTLTAQIAGVSVRTEGSLAETRIRATTPALTEDEVFTAGTPVTAEVNLRRDDIFDMADDFLRSLVTPQGER
jgi:multidrug efflux pump subunit AcrA (membrane-fusion protein)